MERMIAKLLQELEEGKMSRQQFIQTMALSATAGAAVVGAATPAVAQEPAAGGTRLTAVAVNHLSFDVADYRKVSAFYAELLGIELFQGTLKTQNHGRVGRSGCYITFRGAGNRGRAADAVTPKLQHIAIAVEPWDRHEDSSLKGAPEVAAELKRRGLLPEGTEPVIHDPEGYPIQVIGRTYETKN